MKPVLNFQSQYARSRADLSALVEQKERQFKHVAVADLSLGSWAPKSLAAQLLGQLTKRDFAVKGRLSSVTTDLGDAMSAGIDQEGRGNRTILDAVATVRQILRSLGGEPSALLILVPAYGNHWRVEDRLLVEYSRSLHPALDLTLVIGGANAAAFPADWTISLSGNNDHAVLATRTLAGLLPTALSPAHQQALGQAESITWIPLRNGWAIVAPEFRSDPEEAQSRFTPEEIRSLKGGPLQEFVPYATLRSATQRDPWQFCLEAWNHFGTGYRELALYYISIAEELATVPEMKATITCHKQSMRIAMSQYEEAGNEPAPDANLPSKFRAQLMQTKGWGLVMAGNAKAAAPFLHEALNLSKPEVLDVPYLYLMNITALSEVRSGNFERALEMENAIRDAIDSLGISNDRLVFVNSLNLARLHRYAGNLNEAELWYRRAFATVEGGRSDIDSINANLCLARVEEGRADHRANFLCWLRAALCWIATDRPEALNWRVQNLVLGKGGVISVDSIGESYAVVERLAKGFLDNLVKLSVLAGTSVEVDTSKHSLCRFENVSNVIAAPRASRYVGGLGWGVAAGTAEVSPSEFGPHYRDLNLWLSAWIQNDSGNEGETCYWIDRRHGMDGPSDRESFFNHAADLNLDKLVYEGEPLSLTATQLRDFYQTREARQNPMVVSTKAGGENVTIEFRRYFPPLTLKSDEAVVFRTIQARPVIAEAKLLLSAQGIGEERVESIIAYLRNAHAIQIVRPFEKLSQTLSKPQLSLCA